MKTWHETKLEYDYEGREFEGHKPSSSKRKKKTAKQIRMENKAAFEQARKVEPRTVMIKRRDGVVVTQRVDVSCVPANWRNPTNPYNQDHIAHQSAFNRFGRSK